MFEDLDSEGIDLFIRYEAKEPTCRNVAKKSLFENSVI